MIPTIAVPAESTRCCVGGPVFYGLAMVSSRGRASLLSFIDLFQLVIPEEQPVALIKDDVEGGVAGVSPSLDDRALPAAQASVAMVFPDPHPFAYARFLRPHGISRPVSPSAGGSHAASLVRPSYAPRA
jgi:hypothetical protein